MKVIGENAQPAAEKSNAAMSTEEIIAIGRQVHGQTIKATHKLISLFEQSTLSDEIEEIRKNYGFHLACINPETHPEEFRHARALFLVLNDLLKVYAKHKTIHNKLVKEQTP